MLCAVAESMIELADEKFLHQERMCTQSLVGRVFHPCCVGVCACVRACVCVCGCARARVCMCMHVYVGIRLW